MECAKGDKYGATSENQYAAQCCSMIIDNTPNSVLLCTGSSLMGSSNFLFLQLLQFLITLQFFPGLSSINHYFSIIKSWLSLNL